MNKRVTKSISQYQSTIKEVSAKIFVERLLTEGANVACDETQPSFKQYDELPDFYDENLFKKGQHFYHKNIFAVFAAKIFGLISVLAIPTILKILIHTKMSGSELTAYRRYLATIFHMTVWYDSDFKPGSKLWKSIAEVRSLHNNASKSGCKAGLNRISQKDMALTQFGFMGYQLARSKYFGLDHATDEEWRGFIHLWKVVGYLMGIEDRFNVCRGTVAETKAICEQLITDTFEPLVRKHDTDFEQMSQYLVNGLWAINPVLNFNVVMCVLDMLLDDNPNFRKSTVYIGLSFWEKCLFFLMAWAMLSLKWAPFRWYFNHTRHRDLWFMKNFPFLAYYKFGYGNSHVKILGKVE